MIQALFKKDVFGSCPVYVCLTLKKSFLNHPVTLKNIRYFLIFLYYGVIENLLNRNLNIFKTSFVCILKFQLRRFSMTPRNRFHDGGCFKRAI